MSSVRQSQKYLEYQPQSPTHSELSFTTLSRGKAGSTQRSRDVSPGVQTQYSRQSRSCISSRTKASKTSKVSRESKTSKVSDASRKTVKTHTSHTSHTSRGSGSTVLREVSTTHKSRPVIIVESVPESPRGNPVGSPAGSPVSVRTTGRTQSYLDRPVKEMYPDWKSICELPVEQWPKPLTGPTKTSRSQIYPTYPIGHVHPPAFPEVRKSRSRRSKNTVVNSHSYYGTVNMINVNVVIN